MTVPPAPPAIVLIRPQLGENIGAVARAMLNFGLTDLRLVAPRDGWPNPAAGPAAAGADSVIGNARACATLAEAVADCTMLYATTVRRRGVMKPVLTPVAAAAEMQRLPGRAAILFGAERSGMDADDVAAAHRIITVPVNPDFGSLNLAQAAIIIAYEWAQAAAAQAAASGAAAAGAPTLAQPPLVPLDPPAPLGEVEDLYQHLVRELDRADYFNPPERAAVTRRAVRTLLTRTGWTANDVRMFHGVLVAVGRAGRRGPPQD